LKIHVTDLWLKYIGLDEENPIYSFEINENILKDNPDVLMKALIEHCHPLKTFLFLLVIAERLKQFSLEYPAEASHLMQLTPTEHDQVFNDLEYLEEERFGPSPWGEHCDLIVPTFYEKNKKELIR